MICKQIYISHKIDFLIANKIFYYKKIENI